MEASAQHGLLGCYPSSGDCTTGRTIAAHARNTGKSLRKVLLRFVDPPKARRQHTARAPRALFLRMRFYRRHTVGSKEEYAGSVPVLVFQNITQATSHVCASRVGENGEHDGSSTT